MAKEILSHEPLTTSQQPFKCVCQLDNFLNTNDSNKRFNYVLKCKVACLQFFGLNRNFVAIRIQKRLRGRVERARARAQSPGSNFRFTATKLRIEKPYFKKA